MWIILLLILTPISAGFIFFLVSGKAGLFCNFYSVLVSFAMSVGGIVLLFSSPGIYEISLPESLPPIIHSINSFYTFSTQGNSRLFASGFGIMMFVLSIVLHNAHNLKSSRKNFHAWFMLSAGFGFATILAGDLYLMVLFWGMGVIPLYMVMNGNDEMRSSTALKTIIMHGGSYGFALTGIVLASFSLSTTSVSQIEPITGVTVQIAFWLIFAGLAVQMGFFPVQTWIIEWGRFAGRSVSAIWPLFLIRIPAVYILSNLCGQWFLLTETTVIVLFSISFLTIFFASVMSFTESAGAENSNYLVVLASGLMLMGLATGNALGSLASFTYLFSMGALLAAFYVINGKDGLRQKKIRKENSPRSDVSPVSSTSLFRYLPALLVGIPPFGAIASHILLLAALWQYFGSAELAPFMTLFWFLAAITGISTLMANGILLFRHFGKPGKKRRQNAVSVGISGISGLILLIILSQLSVFALLKPVQSWFLTQFFIGPAGFWDSQIISFALVSLLLAFAFSWWIVDFIQKKKNTWLLQLEKREAEKHFDIYNLTFDWVYSINNPLSRAHDGILQSYLVWVFIAMILLFMIL